MLELYDEAVDAKLDAIRKREIDVNSADWGRTLTQAQINTLDAERVYLDEAEIYIWTKHMVNLMKEAARDFPSNTILQPYMVNSMAGWWWLGRDSRILVRSWISTPEVEGIESYAERRDLNAVLFGNTGEGLYISGFTYDHFEPSGLIVPITSTIWPFGQSLGDHLHQIHSVQAQRHAKMGERERESWCYSAMKISTLFMVGSILMNQKLLRLTEGRTGRGVRRRAERLKVESKVNVVTLRRPEYLKHETEHRKVEWDCQWVVSSHWRSQEHIEPGRAPIRIGPYIKGPEDKPLKNASRIFMVKD